MTDSTQHILSTGNVTTYLNVQAKGSTRFGVKHEGQVRSGHNVSVTPRKSVRLFGTIDNHIHRMGESYDITFAVGDVAEYDSYNLNYVGEIVAVGAKSVTIRDPHGRNHRLNLHTFSWRNHDFDLAVILKRNSEWLD